VKVTLWLRVDGFRDELTAVDVDAGCAVTDSVTCGARLKLLSPAWSYLTVQVPVPLVMVKVAPTFVQTPALLYETGKPELEVAATVKLVL
jgi:hypothetical protein